MKKQTFGMVLILFGILMELAEIGPRPFLGFPYSMMGVVAGFAGLIFAAAGCFEKKQ